MRRSLKGSVEIAGPDEFRVVKKILFHLEVLAANRAVNNGMACMAENSASRPWSNGAVDNCQIGTILFDVLHRDTDESIAEWITDVKNRAPAPRNHGLDVDAGGRMLRRNQVK